MKRSDKVKRGTFRVVTSSFAAFDVLRRRGDTAPMRAPTPQLPVASTVAFVALLLATGAAAQGPWEAHTRAGEAAFAAGDMARAEVELRSALDLAKENGLTGRRLETSLSDLARLYEHQGRLDQAQPLFELMLVATEHRAGPQHEDLLEPLAAAGRVALRAGDVPAAAAHLKRYVEVADVTGTADATELWQILGLLARMGSLQNSPEDALLFQRRAVAVMDEDRFPDAADRAQMLESLAQLELLHGSTAAAESTLDRVVALHLEMDNPPAAMAALSSAAATALGAGQPEVAERLVERVLELEPPPEVMISARKVLAEAAWQRVPRGGTLEDWLAASSDSPALAHAADRLRSLLAVQRLTLPPDHPDIGETVSRQVEVAARRGDLAGAEDAQLQLVQNRVPVGGEGLVASLSALVAIELQAGKTAAAAASNGDLIRALDGLARADDPRLRPALERQLQLLTQLDRKQEAKAVKKRLKKR